MATAKSAGGVVRLGIEWNLVESNRGSYDWSASDRVVEAAARHGLDVIGLLYTTPEWARDPSGDPTSPLTPPRDEQQFARFASAAAERFGPSVRTWEVWNEPNIQDFWTTGADPAAYSRLLSATYTAVKAAQPGATVISGGLAPAETRPGHMAPNTFLSLMYTMGAKGYFDGYGIHPYSYPGVPVDDSQPWNPWSQMIDARRIMTTNGDGAKGVWITEFGAPTGTSPKAVSPELQAVIDSTGITAASRLPWIKSFLVYSVRDDGTDPAHGEDNFGVVARDWTPKPAYTAVGAAAREHGCSAESVAAVPQREDSANAGDRRE